MTVYIEKPAVNLREELASLRNQGGYQEQQFYFDGLVTNGTFDTDTTGWTADSLTTSDNATLSNEGGQLKVTNTGNNGVAYQSFPTVSGKLYQFSVDLNYITNTAYALRVGSTLLGFDYVNDSKNTGAGETGAKTFTFVATGSICYVTVGNLGVAGDYSLWDNISVFEIDANDDVIHTMPKGWKPKDVYEDGLLQREGAAYDYEVIYDGFDYKIKSTVAPSATTQTCVIGVKA